MTDKKVIFSKIYSKTLLKLCIVYFKLMFVGLKRQNLEELVKGIYLPPATHYYKLKIYNPQTR